MNEKQNLPNNRSEQRHKEMWTRVEKKPERMRMLGQEKKKKKQSGSVRGYQWEDDGYISSPQPGQVRL